MDEHEHKTQGSHRFYNLLLKNISSQLHLLLLLPVALILTFTSYNYYYLSAFVLPLFTHTFEKKYIFLLCTTILTFITKNMDVFSLKECNNIEHILSLDDVPIVKGKLNTEEQEQVQEYEQEPKVDDNDEKESLQVESDQEDDGKEQSSTSCVDMDTEELNKKIEEFIKKMKQDLRLEPKQHLITV